MQLVDTNILSELVRPQPNSGVLDWAGQVSSLALSVVSLEELVFGLSAKPNPRVEAWFDDFFDSRLVILPATVAIARRAGQLRGGLRRKGVTRSQADMLIAATSSVHGLTLVTRNERDFEGCGIAILNPFV